MELFRALAVLAEPPRAETAPVADALGLGKLPAADEYTETFVFQLYPYASVYLGAEGMLGGEAKDRVAGFWRALHLAPPTEVDHLSTLLAMYARLCELEAGAGDRRAQAGWRGARQALLWEHLLSWLPAYLTKLEEIAPPFYRAWGLLLADALAGEAAVIGTQRGLSLHLREAPDLADPRAGSFEDFLRALLAPVRCGMILVRDDLARAARELKTGARLGERSFILRALFEQDAAGALGWLEAEALRWRRRHEQLREPFGETARAWQEKAGAAALLLNTLRREIGV